MRKEERLLIRELRREQRPNRLRYVSELFVPGIDARKIGATKSWKNYTYNVELPKIQNLSDELKIYIWNKEKKPFYIDNFSIKLYNIN